MWLLLTAVAVFFINTTLSTQPGIVPQEQHELEACLPLICTCQDAAALTKEATNKYERHTGPLLFHGFSLRNFSVLSPSKMKLEKRN